MRAYFLANKERIRRQKYAHARGFKVAHTEEEWQAKLALFDNRCAYCRSSYTKLTRDHVIPIGMMDPGIVDRIENIVPACLGCNARKAGMNVKAGPRTSPVPERHCPICGRRMNPSNRNRTCSQDCRMEWSRRYPAKYDPERVAAQREGIRRAKERRAAA